MDRAVTLTLPHDLGRTEARRRLDAGFGDLARHLGGVGSISRTWNGDRLEFAFAIMGQVANGLVDVEDRSVRLEIVLPGLLGAIAGKLKARLRHGGQLLLEKK